MSFKCVKDIRRWADEDIESVGRDVLRRQAHKLADAVCETIVASAIFVWLASRGGMK